MDITKLPVLEGVIGFFLLVLAVGFYGAFAAVNSDKGETAASATPAASTPAGPPSNQVSVSMKDNSFDPTAVTVPAGQIITFTVTNNGKVPHNMHIAGADNKFDTADDAVSVPASISGGKEGKVVWNSASASGQIDFHCDFHPSQMTGTITVQ